MIEGQFKVWAPGFGEEEHADVVEGETPEAAAETWMYDHWSDLDGPDEAEVHVRTHDGKLLKLRVLAEETVNFHAEVKES